LEFNQQARLENLENKVGGKTRHQHFRGGEEPNRASLEIERTACGLETTDSTASVVDARTKHRALVVVEESTPHPVEDAPAMAPDRNDTGFEALQSGGRSID